MKIMGFTLLEIMIVLLMVMILASLAVTTYQFPVLKAHQAAAKIDLVNLATAFEEYYEQHHSYKNIRLEELNFHAHCNEYDFQIISATDDNFKIAAIPKDSGEILYLDQDGNQGDD